MASFLRDNARWLAAGGLLTFGSAFGQTYFIALFAGEIRAEFGLSHGAWGSLYAAGTIAAAVAMLTFGGVADRLPVRRLAALNMGVFAALCLAMAAAPAAWALVPILFGLRFCGQDMMTHISVVAVGRWFQRARGRALSITAMGMSLSEAVLPFAFVALMAVAGWRGAWIGAALLLAAMIPMLRLLLVTERNPGGDAQATVGTGMEGRHWTRGETLRHWLFWACVPGLFAYPMFGTAFFFQQVHLVELKGWPLAGFAALFPVFTAATLAALMGGGWLVDRFGAGRVLPVYLLPAAAGFAVAAAAGSLGVAALAMALLGTSTGLSAATLGAFWPEHYGTRHLGSIRSVSTALMVFATALGPALTGALIDAGVAYTDQLAAMSGVMLAASGLLALATRRARRLIPRIAV